MRISLHLTARLPDARAAPALLDHLRGRAEALGWLAEAAAPGAGGDVGLRFLPGPPGSGLEVRVAADGRLEASAETATAGPEVHRDICLLLVEAANAFGFEPESVEDDAGYWDRWDDRALRTAWKTGGASTGGGARERGRRGREVAGSVLAVLAMLGAGMALLRALNGDIAGGKWWFALAVGGYFASGAVRPRG